MVVVPAGYIQISPKPTVCFITPFAPSVFAGNVYENIVVSVVPVVRLTGDVTFATCVEGCAHAGFAPAPCVLRKNPDVPAGSREKAAPP
jgi:hypothetical protein